MAWRFGRGALGRFALLLLAACLTADAALPLMPGAFVWDPRESIDAVNAASVQTVRAIADRPWYPARDASTASKPSVAQAAATRYDGRRRLVRTAPPRLPPSSETLASSDAPDDH